MTDRNESSPRIKVWNVDESVSTEDSDAWNETIHMRYYGSPGWGMAVDVAKEAVIRCRKRQNDEVLRSNATSNSQDCLVSPVADSTRTAYSLSTPPLWL